MALLSAMNDEGRTIVLITHDADVASVATRRVHIRDGRIASDERATRSAA
jgi:putative ABC transport system ATP-binding protein